MSKSSKPASKSSKPAVVRPQSTAVTAAHAEKGSVVAEIQHAPTSAFVVHGITCEGGEFEQRGRNALPAQEHMVVSILAVGVMNPVEVRVEKNNALTLVKGRQRWKAVCEANRRLREAGKEREILLPYRVVRGNASTLLMRDYDDNAARVELSAFESVDAIIALYNELSGGEISKIGQISRRFAIDEATVRSRLLMGEECIPALRESVEAGRLAYSAALTIVRASVSQDKLPKSEFQNRELEKLLNSVRADGKKKSAADVKAEQRAASGKRVIPPQRTLGYALKAAAENPDLLARISEEMSAAELLQVMIAGEAEAFPSSLEAFFSAGEALRARKASAEAAPKGKRGRPRKGSGPDNSLEDEAPEAEPEAEPEAAPEAEDEDEAPEAAPEAEDEDEAPASPEAEDEAPAMAASAISGDEPLGLDDF